MLTKQEIARLTAEEINKNAKSGEEVTSDQLRQFLDSFERSDRIVHTSEIRKLIADGEKSVPITTGIDDLDHIIGGFYEGQVIVLTARPKSGKTSFALQFIDNMLPMPSLFLGLEQNAKELIEQAEEEGFDVPDFYTPLDSSSIERTPDWIHLKIVETQFLVPESPKVAIIDHFGYLAMAHALNEAYTFSVIRTMQALKQVARQTKTAIIVIVHTTKGDPTTPPSTEDLFGSGGFHQEADIVLSLWREAYKENKEVKSTNNTLLQVLANRRKGKSGAIKFVYQDGKFIQGEWQGHDERLQIEKDIVNKKWKQLVK